MPRPHDWLERMPASTRVTAVVLPSGITLRVYERGAGPRVLFLHGFPERAISWTNQLAAFPDAHCIAPDLRGFGGSDAPWGRWNYQTPLLVEDIVQLIAHFGGPLHVVAHDWGAALAWDLAARHPDQVRSLTILNGPSIPLMLRSLMIPRQLRKSWYMLFFQLPILPERWLGASPEIMMRRTFLHAAGRRAAFSAETIAPYVEQVRTGFRGIDWYRGALLKPALKLRPVRCPVHILWGLRDPVLDAGIFADSKRYEGWVANLTIETLPGVGHWTQLEAPDAVNAAIATVLRAH